VLVLMFVGALIYLRRREQEEARQYDQQVREKADPSQPPHPSPE
jgi:hypothetical protein